MRRWNGWGDETNDYPVSEATAGYLASLVGEGTPQEDVPFETVVGQVPESRLPAHPLVSDDKRDRVLHARGQSLPDWLELKSGRIVTFPDGVAYPTSDKEVADLIRYARDAGVRLIPYGGGTSVAGHINPAPGDAPVLTVDMGRMNRLRRFDEANMLATFGAGISGPDVEAALRARGCTLGHFPQSFEYSTLGGWVATRSSGQQSMHYGRIEGLFAGGAVETPSGRLEMPPFPASAAGPDLRQVILGSEGRMGIITEATVRVSPLPGREEFRAVFFPDFEAGRAAVRAIAQARLPLSMLRLSTAVETQTTLTLAGHERLIGGVETFLKLRGAGDEKSMLVMAATGDDRTVKAATKSALELCREQGGVHAGTAFGGQWRKSRFRTPYLRNTLWGMGYAVDTLETATGWDNVPDMIAAIENALRGADGEKIHVFTHLSHVYPTGCSVYTTYLFRLAADPDATLRRWQAMKTAASEAVVGQGGTISHQHGVGTDHAPYLAAEKGELGMRAIRELCRVFDPDGVMNPGKLIREP